MKQKLRKPVKPSAADFLREGNASYRAGRFHLAAQAFGKARDLEPRNAAVLYNMASAKERVGEIAEAMALLTQAARFKPAWPEPPARLALLAGMFRLDSAKDLDPHGLLACFAYDSIDLRVLASLAYDHLRAVTPLGPALERATAGDAGEAARSLIMRRTERVLSDRLFLAALAAGPVCDIGLEKLLTAIRRTVLLELSAGRFEDKALGAFLLALARQCLANDHVFAVQPDEEERLASLPPDWDAVCAGDPEQARRLMLRLLYEPPDSLVPQDASEEAYKAVRPRGLGLLLDEWAQEREALQKRAACLPSLGTISDATSRKVASQYEAYPYPRWTSLTLPSDGSAPRALSRFFSPERLAFMEKPFRVLIAGAGTGRQAVASAAGYGPGADVLAVDLSRTSLAYARYRAQRYGRANLRFAQADLLELADSGEGAFDIIECVGVLHHMADPFKGWRALTEALRPDGLMLVGLYSPVSRRAVTALRAEPAYPGPGCGAAQARQYRAELIERADETAAILTSSQDFYTLNEFRDYVLHEHERPIFLSEIEAFLGQNGLAFRGFQLPAPIASHFIQSSTGASWPGTLEEWARYEESYPRCFDGMYMMWCEKAGG